MIDLRIAMTAHYGLDCVRIAPLTGGLIHQVWQVETSQGRFAVKLYRGRDWTPERVRSSLRVQAHAGNCGLPAPRIRPTLSGEWLAPAGEGWVVVQELAPGARRTPEELTPPAARAVGATLAWLHRALALLPFEGTPLLPETAAVRERCLRLLAAAQAAPQPDELDRLAVEAARFRLELLDRSPIDPAIYANMTAQVIHGDFFPANLLFDPDGRVSAVLDWDFAGLHWRELEVARAAVETALTADDCLDPARLTAFLEGYQAELPLSPAQRRWMFRLWLNYLLWSLYPLPLRYEDPGRWPEAGEVLARRRHRMLLLLARHLPELEEGGW